jgi:nitric oxide reductase large subunit
LLHLISGNNSLPSDLEESDAINQTLLLLENRANTYDPLADVVTVTNDRAQAIRQVSADYAVCFVAVLTATRVIYICGEITPSPYTNPSARNEQKP